MDKDNIKKIMNCPKCDSRWDKSKDWVDFVDVITVGKGVKCPDCHTNFWVSKKEGSNVELERIPMKGAEPPDEP